jgi:hypothetical protein
MPDRKTDERVIPDRRKASRLPSRPAIRTAMKSDRERRAVLKQSHSRDVS